MKKWRKKLDVVTTRAIQKMADDRHLESWPLIASHHGAPIFEGQTVERINDIVRPALDRVIELVDFRDLLIYLRDWRNPPEARTLAGFKILAIWDLHAERRQKRPDIDCDLVRADIATACTFNFRSPWGYCSLLDHAEYTVVAKRPPEFAERLDEVEYQRERRRLGPEACEKYGLIKPTHKENEAHRAAMKASQLKENEIAMRPFMKLIEGKTECA